MFWQSVGGGARGNAKNRCTLNGMKYWGAERENKSRAACVWWANKKEEKLLAWLLRGKRNIFHCSEPLGSRTLMISVQRGSEVILFYFIFFYCESCNCGGNVHPLKTARSFHNTSENVDSWSSNLFSCFDIICKYPVWFNIMQIKVGREAPVKDTWS